MTSGSTIGLCIWMRIAIVVFATNLLPSALFAEPRSPQDFVIIVPPAAVPEISFEMEDGVPTTLARFQGRVVLVNIWATWCAPCRHEMPTLDRLQAMLGSSEFEVVALSIDRAGIRPVAKFYKEIGISELAIYVDPTMRAMRSLNVAVLPTTLLIGPDGREVARLIGSARWDSPEMVAYLKDWRARLLRNYRARVSSETKLARRKLAR